MLPFVHTMFSQPATLTLVRCVAAFVPAQVRVRVIVSYHSLCLPGVFVSSPVFPALLISYWPCFLAWGTEVLVWDDILLSFPSGSIDWVASLSFT